MASIISSNGTINQVDVKVLGDAPASEGIGDLYQAHAQALGNAAHNAATAQQQSNVTAQVAQTQGLALVYTMTGASPGSVPDAPPVPGGSGVLNTASTTNTGLLDALNRAWDEDES